ncbi:hypothetical protein L6164_004904 [Bauhinia variegata]|uniref:Uncharacterized protein n=1 Tax=Bauhinia variegata TaxID=167791 RepID=A0ACB9PRI8_BAUVA|nr:hypothetical protein L6164_004904 [Bauhinia variegata]
MENSNPESRGSINFFHSQWLQATVSDLDEKMKNMLTILEDGHSSNQGANNNIHNKTREDLRQMLEEFSKSYHALATAYYQMRSQKSHTFHSGSSSSSVTTKILYTGSRKRTTGNLEEQKVNRSFNFVMEDPDIKYDSTKNNFEPINELEDECHELISAGPCHMEIEAEFECKDTQMEDGSTGFFNKENIVMNLEGLELVPRIEDSPTIDYKFNSIWSGLEFNIAKLAEDNRQQLVELVRRNDEKRRTIKRLQLEVEALKRENRTFQISLGYSNTGAECNQPRRSKSRGTSIGKLFRGCIP